MTRVLMIDDDVELFEMMREYLTTEGFVVTGVHDGTNGLSHARSGHFDLVLLDVMLPEVNGFEVLRRLRSSETPGVDVPVIMLTARGQAVDRIVGLEVGADDYLPKPFDDRELVARMRAILRRSSTATARATSATTRPEVLALGDMCIDIGARLVRLSNQTISLTGAEFSLLLLLVRSAGQVVSREYITREVFDRKLDSFDRSLDTHISRLRRKLGPHPSGAERIRTARSCGYIYTLPGAEPAFHA